MRRRPRGGRESEGLARRSTGHQAAACWPLMPLLDGLGKPGSGVNGWQSSRPKPGQATSTFTPAGPSDSTLQLWSATPTPLAPDDTPDWVTVCRIRTSWPVLADSSTICETTVCCSPKKCEMFWTVEVMTRFPSGVTSAAGTYWLG